LKAVFAIELSGLSGEIQALRGCLFYTSQLRYLFKVGTGLSDKQRRNPPKVGAIIVYRFQELTRDGLFPSSNIFRQNLMYIGQIPFTYERSG